MKIEAKKILVLALAATFLGASISSLAEEVESRKLSIMKVTGENAYIRKGTNRRLKVINGMGLSQGNHVETGDDSTVYIEADGDRFIRLDENSTVQITKASAKSLKLTLGSGNVFFNVDKPLDEDEEMIFEAAHTSMSIRGTSGVFTFNPLKMEFYLIEGSVTWDLGNGNTVDLKAGEAIKMERDFTNMSLGPAAEVIYTLKTTAPFQWTDLDHDGLEAIMENRDKIDLTAIGLDTPEKIQEAFEKVEAYKKEQEAVKVLYDNDDDDCYYDNNPSPSTPTQPSVTTDSNADEEGNENQDSGSDSENNTGTGDETGSGAEDETESGAEDETGSGAEDETGSGTEDETGSGTEDETGSGTEDETGSGTGDENGSGTENETGSGTGDGTGTGTTTEKYYVNRTDGPTIDNGTYNLQPGVNGTYIGMEEKEEIWYWKWANYNDSIGTFENGSWVWSSEDYPETLDSGFYTLIDADYLEALIPTE